MNVHLIQHAFALDEEKTPVWERHWEKPPAPFHSIAANDEVPYVRKPRDAVAKVPLADEGMPSGLSEIVASTNGYAGHAMARKPASEFRTQTCDPFVAGLEETIYEVFVKIPLALKIAVDEEIAPARIWKLRMVASHLVHAQRANRSIGNRFKPTEDIGIFLQLRKSLLRSRHADSPALSERYGCRVLE